MFVLNGKKISKIYNSCFYCTFPKCITKTKTFYIITLDKTFRYIAKICDNCLDSKEYSRSKHDWYKLTDDEVKEVQVLFAKHTFEEMFNTFDVGCDTEVLKNILETVINERCIREIIE